MSRKRKEKPWREKGGGGRVGGKEWDEKRGRKEAKQKTISGILNWKLTIFNEELSFVRKYSLSLEKAIYRICQLDEYHFIKNSTFPKLTLNILPSFYF